MNAIFAVVLGEIMMAHLVFSVTEWGTRDVSFVKDEDTMSVIVAMVEVMKYAPTAMVMVMLNVMCVKVNRKYHMNAHNAMGQGKFKNK